MKLSAALGLTTLANSERKVRSQISGASQHPSKYSYRPDSSRDKNINGKRSQKQLSKPAVREQILDCILSLQAETDDPPQMQHVYDWAMTKSSSHWWLILCFFSWAPTKAAFLESYYQFTANTVNTRLPEGEPQGKENKTKTYIVSDRKLFFSPF